MDSFTIVQVKEVEDREAIKQLEKFIKYEENKIQQQQSMTDDKDATEQTTEVETISTNTIHQLKVVKNAVVNQQNQ